MQNLVMFWIVLCWGWEVFLFCVGRVGLVSVLGLGGVVKIKMLKNYFLGIYDPG